MSTVEPDKTLDSVAYHKLPLLSRQFVAIALAIKKLYWQGMKVEVFPYWKKSFSLLQKKLFLIGKKVFPYCRRNFSLLEKKFFLIAEETFPYWKKSFSLLQEKLFLIGKKVFAYCRGSFSLLEKKLVAYCGWWNCLKEQYFNCAALLSSPAK